MPTTYKKFIFITPTNISQHNVPTPETLEAIFETYQKLADLKKSGIATPYIDVLEIPEDFYEFLLNQITVNFGICEMSKRLVTFENLNAKIICLSHEALEQYLSIYEGNIRGLLEKLTKNLGDLSAQLAIVHRFKDMFMLNKKG